VNDELERIWKWSWHNFKVLSWHSPGKIEENHEKPVRIADYGGKI
jgi:hypothetical protein